MNPKDLLDFTGRVVLVTGSSSGIGAGIAVRFAEAGADVAVNYHNNKSAAERTAETIEALGQKAVAIKADVRHRKQVERLVGDTVASLGPLDVLVNNAGVQPLAPMMEMSDDEWKAVIDTNLHGVFLCTQMAAAEMIRRSTEGAIVNIASIEGMNPAANHSHYDAAKAGVLMHTRNAARELGEHGIRVNAVSPGVIDTGNLENEWPDGMARYSASAPLGRTGTPEEVADACLFLASPAARWITGANLIVDGGVLTSTVY